MVTFEELIWEGIAKSSKYEGVHAAHFDYPCKRYAYYKITEPELFNISDRKTKFRFWIGEALHSKPVLPESKVKVNTVEYSGCHFSPDEYYDGYLLEKKSVANWFKLPKGLRRPSLHHVIRCEHYKMALELNNIRVKAVGLLYLDYVMNKLSLFTTENNSLNLRLTPEIKESFDVMNEDLKLSVAKRILPSRFLSWLCDYCSAYTKCFTVDGRE